MKQAANIFDNTNPSRWDWDEQFGPERVSNEFKTNGFSLFRMPEVSEKIALNPNGFLQRLMNIDCFNLMDVTHVMPLAESMRLVQKRAGFGYHTDSAPFLPPTIQVLICLKQAPTGGESYIQDGWTALQQIEVTDSELFKTCFEIPRIDNHSRTSIAGPLVFSRWGNLVCTCPTKVLDGDVAGKGFHDYLGRLKPISYRLEPGDVTVLNNQRFVHARTAFKGDRHLIRIHAWTREPIACPRNWMEIAEASRLKLAEDLREEPLRIRQRFGCAPFEEFMLEPSTVETDSDDLVAATERLRLKRGIR